MRVLVDIPEDRLKKLGRISQVRKVSRAAVLREAIDAYLADRETISLEKGRGLWGNHKIDGLKYQERLRREWSRRSSTRIS